MAYTPRGRRRAVYTSFLAKYAKWHIHHAGVYTTRRQKEMPGVTDGRRRAVYTSFPAKTVKWHVHLTTPAKQANTTQPIRVATKRLKKQATM